VNDEFERIFIPVPERGCSIREFSLSVRLAHVLNAAGVKLVGDLNGRSFGEFARVRNCGKRTLDEIAAFVRTLQLGTSESSPAISPTRDPDILQVSEGILDISLKEIPLSVRLAGILRSAGFEKLRDLHGTDMHDLLKVKNCGNRSILELRELLRRAEAGEFTAGPTGGFAEGLVTIIRSIDVGMRKLAARDRKIVEERLLGNRGESRTLESVGHEFGMTRERVRQIVKGACEKIRRAGGPVLARALEAVERDLEARVLPLTEPLLSEQLSPPGKNNDHIPPLYARLLASMSPSIPVWTRDAIREGTDSPESEELQVAMEKWLFTTGEHPTMKEAFEHLRAQPAFAVVSPLAFLSIIRRARRIIVDFPYVDQPRLRLRRLRLFDITLPVLSDSSEPLTPEKIIERARLRFGADAVMLSGRRERARCTSGGVPSWTAIVWIAETFRLSGARLDSLARSIREPAKERKSSNLNYRSLRQA
jgi:Sigma-70, region 4/Bacterial RNA polymerase, alpha chain C terminal domain